MSKDRLELPPVLAAPTQHPRRRRLIMAVAAHLAVILGMAGLVGLIHGSPSTHGPAKGHGSHGSPAVNPSIRPVATLTNPDALDYALASGMIVPSADGTTLAASNGDTSVYLWDVGRPRSARTAARWL